MSLLHRRPHVDTSLRAIDAFDDCTLDELRVISGNSARLELPAGWCLFRELHIQREVVALLDGAAVLSIRGVPAGVMRSGACAGSTHSLGRHRWPASGITSTRSVVVVLASREVAQVLKDVPRLADRLVPFEWSTAALADRRGSRGGPTVLTGS